MGLLIVKNDFMGKLALAKSNLGSSGTDFIDDAIRLYEENILIELFGLDLFNLFRVDVNVGTRLPQTPIYQTLYNKLAYEYNGLWISQGLKDVLLGFVFCYYVRDNPIKQTLNGSTKNQSEASSEPSYTFVAQRWNESVNSYNAVKEYLIKDQYNAVPSYPTYKGICGIHGTNISMF